MRGGFPEFGPWGVRLGVRRVVLILEEGGTDLYVVDVYICKSEEFINEASLPYTP